jgi:hypothetical protein
VAVGTNSLSSSNFFASSAIVKKVMPVALPPGRLRLEPISKLLTAVDPI